MHIDSEREMKMHIKTYKKKVRNETFRYEDFDFAGNNKQTVLLFHGKSNSSDFDCGLCNFKAKSWKKLNTHLSSCEVMNMTNATL